MADDKKKTAEELSEDKVNDRIAQAVEKAMAAAMPTAMMAVAQILKPPAAVVPPPPQFPVGDRCTKCQQFRYVCKDKHVLLVVAPANPRRYTRFPGIIVNGVIYISPRPGAPIYVPEDNDILFQLQKYEEEEENLREGNVQSHNSGTLSPHAQNNQIHNANPQGFRGMMQGG